MGYLQTGRETQRRPLSRRYATNAAGEPRVGCKHMKLDKAKVGDEPRFPWQRKKKKRYQDRKNTIEHMRRVGKVSMIQIGEDEFRTPNRRERRSAGIRHRTGKNPLTALVRRSPRRDPLIRLQPSEQLEVAQETGRLVRMRPYTRRAKGVRKTRAEATRLAIEQQAVADTHRLIDRARGKGETRWNPAGSY